METQNTDIKTKYMTSERAGTPTLLPEWGSLNNFLKVVLTEGYNTQVVNSFKIDSVSKIGTLVLPIGHGFLINDVIKLEEATQALFNKEYRVLASRPTEIDVFSDNTSGVTEVTSLSTLSCKIAPLGFSVVYENTLEGILCLKNSSLQSPGILKLMDSQPPNGYLPTWSKFARITIGQEIDLEGNFIGNKKVPYWEAYPEAEKTGNGVAGAAGIHGGGAKWYYAVQQNAHYFYEEQPLNWTGSIGWKLIGDGDTFYLMIANRGIKTSYCIYGFGNYTSENSQESSNLVLQSAGGYVAANSVNSYANYSRTRNSFPNFGGNIGNYILSLAEGRIPGSNYYCQGLSLAGSTERPWRSAFKTVNPITGYLISSPIYIVDSSQVFRGTHRGVKVLYGQTFLTDGILTNNHEIIVSIQDLELSVPSNILNTMPLIFSLRDWEEVP